MKDLVKQEASRQYVDTVLVTELVNFINSRMEFKDYRALPGYLALHKAAPIVNLINNYIAEQVIKYESLQ